MAYVDIFLLPLQFCLMNTSFFLASLHAYHRVNYELGPIYLQ